MRRRLYGLKLLLFYLVLCGFSGTNQEAVETFRSSMERHDVKELSPFLDQKVDITYDNTESTYSKAQAQMIITEFYNKYKPHHFKIEYMGNVPANDVQYIIGTAHSKTGRFKIYLCIRTRGNRQVICEMKISR
jgi:hypothetical protein